MMIVLFIWEIPNTFNKELSDVSGTKWYAKYVEYAINNNLFPVSENLFFPQKNITRYEVVSILKKLTQ